MSRIPVRTNLNIVNSTITAGGTSQQLQAANPARQFFWIQNTSDTVMWLNFGGAAAANDGVSVAANGGTWTPPPGYCPKNSINVIGATTGKTFAYYIV